ncbi:neurofibromin [Anaeramoeba ignava]|uniref:Neurofibromin n=1 Tax=Anaeramoeba ignava TaxID=1746090 RepID=A0A9Q0R8V1_ANAIG|nr:neurofibromin [Anaeramoeba ignava]
MDFLLKEDIKSILELTYEIGFKNYLNKELIKKEKNKAKLSIEIIKNWINEILKKSTQKKVANSLFEDFKKIDFLIEFLLQVFPDLDFKKIALISDLKEKLIYILKEIQNNSYDGFCCSVDDIFNMKKKQFIKFLASLFLWFQNNNPKKKEKKAKIPKFNDPDFDNYIEEKLQSFKKSINYIETENDLQQKMEFKTIIEEIKLEIMDSSQFTISITETHLFSKNQNQNQKENENENENENEKEIPIQKEQILNNNIQIQKELPKKEQNRDLKYKILTMKQKIQENKRKIDDYQKLQEYKHFQEKESQQKFILYPEKFNSLNQFIQTSEKVSQSLNPLKEDLQDFMNSITKIPSYSTSLFKLLDVKIDDVPVGNIQKIQFKTITSFSNCLRGAFAHFKINFSEEEFKKLITKIKLFEQFDLDPYGVYSEIEDVFPKEYENIIQFRKFSIFILSICDLFVFTVYFKQLFTEKIVEILQENKNILQGSDVDDITRMIYGNIDNFIYFLSDLSKLKDIVQNIMEFLEIQDHINKSEKVIEELFRQSLSKTLFAIFKRLFEENQQEKIKNEVEKNKKKPTKIFKKDFAAGNQTLQKYLTEESIRLLSILTDANFCGDDIESISLSLFNLFDYLGLSIPLLKFTISQTITRISSVQNLFAYSDVSSRILSEFSFIYGAQYLHLTLKPIISEMIEFNQTIKTILDSEKDIPPQFRIINNYISTEIEKKFSGKGLISIGRFIFHRFLCPTLVSPQNYSIIKFPLNERYFKRFSFNFISNYSIIKKEKI